MKRDWTPIRNGIIYCSPACGAGCTHEAYEEAVSLAVALAQKCNKEIGGNWEPRVHENLGWHWCVVQEGSNITIGYGGYLAKGDYYSVGLLGGTPCQVSIRENFEDVSSAYYAQVEAIRIESDKWNTLLKSANC